MQVSAYKCSFDLNFLANSGFIAKQLFSDTLCTVESINLSWTSITGVIPYAVCNIRNGRVYVSAKCDSSDLVCCCCNDDQCVGDVCAAAPFV